MAQSHKNERRPHIVPRSWRILRVAGKASQQEEQLRLNITQLEDMIVGAEAKEVRRRVSGIIEPDNFPARSGPAPLRHDERRALQRQRLHGWLAIGALGLAIIAGGAWLLYRILVVF